MSDIWSVVLGSAAVAAIVSSAFNAVANYLLKRQELERQDMEMAFKLVDLRWRQQEAHLEQQAKRGRQPGYQVWDPLVFMIEYRRGMAEFRRTGKWKKGETTHWPTPGDSP